MGVAGGTGGVELALCPPKAGVTFGAPPVPLDDEEDDDDEEFFFGEDGAFFGEGGAVFGEAGAVFGDEGWLGAGVATGVATGYSDVS